MDILNWLYTKAAGLVKTKANDPNTDLIALGANVGFNRRDDQYQTYGMTLKNCVQSGCTGNTKHYELNITATNVVTVDTPRGIIDITGMGSSVPLTPALAYGSSVGFLINNPDLDLSIANRDNIYLQYSVYYKNTITDNAIPYLISTGVANGLEFNLYNANPTLAGVNNWDGALYVYYELYTLN
jgi:hypothetical protein